MADMLLAGGAAANYLQSIWGYNQECYQFDKTMQQAAMHQRQQMRREWIFLFRADIEGMMNLTITRMDNYILTNTMQIALIVAILGEGSLLPSGDMPLFTSWAFMLAFTGCIVFLLLSTWFAIHASITAHACGLSLLLQARQVRDLPTGTEIDTTRARLQDFEEAELKTQMRIPFARRMKELFTNGVGAAMGQLVSDKAKMPYHYQPDALENFFLNEKIEEEARRQGYGGNAGEGKDGKPGDGKHGSSTDGEQASSSNTNYTPGLDKDGEPIKPDSNGTPEERAEYRRRVDLARREMEYAEREIKEEGHKYAHVAQGQGSMPEMTAESEQWWKDASNQPGGTAAPYAPMVDSKAVTRGAQEGTQGGAQKGAAQGGGGQDSLGGEDNTGRLQIRASHLNIFRILQQHWQYYDAYARVSNSIGSYLMIKAITYFLMTYIFAFQHYIFLSWGVGLLYAFVSRAIAAVDLVLTRCESYVLTCLQMGSIVSVLVAMTVDIIWPNGWPSLFFVPLVCVIHLGWLCYLWLLTFPSNKDSPHGHLPEKFRQVLYIDCLAWKRVEETMAPMEKAIDKHTPKPMEVEMTDMSTLKQESRKEKHERMTRELRRRLRKAGDQGGMVTKVAKDIEDGHEVRASYRKQVKKLNAEDNMVLAKEGSEFHVKGTPGSSPVSSPTRRPVESAESAAGKQTAKILYSADGQREENKDELSAYNEPTKEDLVQQVNDADAQTPWVFTDLADSIGDMVKNLDMKGMLFGEAKTTAENLSEDFQTVMDHVCEVEAYIETWGFHHVEHKNEMSERSSMAMMAERMEDDTGRVSQHNIMGGKSSSLRQRMDSRLSIAGHNNVMRRSDYVHSDEYIDMHTGRSSMINGGESSDVSNHFGVGPDSEIQAHDVRDPAALLGAAVHRSHTQDREAHRAIAIVVEGNDEYAPLIGGNTTGSFEDNDPFDAVRNKQPINPHHQNRDPYIQEVTTLLRNSIPGGGGFRDARSGNVGGVHPHLDYAHGGPQQRRQSGRRSGRRSKVEDHPANRQSVGQFFTEILGLGDSSINGNDDGHFSDNIEELTKEDFQNYSEKVRQMKIRIFELLELAGVDGRVFEDEQRKQRRAASWCVVPDYDASTGMYMPYYLYKDRERVAYSVPDTPFMRQNFIKHSMSILEDNLDTLEENIISLNDAVGIGPKSSSSDLSPSPAGKSSAVSSSAVVSGGGSLDNDGEIDDSHENTTGGGGRENNTTGSEKSGKEVRIDASEDAGSDNTGNKGQTKKAKKKKFLLNRFVSWLGKKRDIYEAPNVIQEIETLQATAKAADRLPAILFNRLMFVMLICWFGASVTQIYQQFGKYESLVKVPKFKILKFKNMNTVTFLRDPEGEKAGPDARSITIANGVGSTPAALSSLPRLVSGDSEVSTTSARPRFGSVDSESSKNTDVSSDILTAKDRSTTFLEEDDSIELRSHVDVDTNHLQKLEGNPDLNSSGCGYKATSTFGSSEEGGSCERSVYHGDTSLATNLLSETSTVGCNKRDNCEDTMYFANDFSVINPPRNKCGEMINEAIDMSLRGQMEQSGDLSDFASTEEYYDWIREGGASTSYNNILDIDADENCNPVVLLYDSIIKCEVPHSESSNDPAVVAEATPVRIPFVGTWNGSKLNPVSMHIHGSDVLIGVDHNRKPTVLVMRQVIMRYEIGDPEAAEGKLQKFLVPMMELYPGLWKVFTGEQVRTVEENPDFVGNPVGARKSLKRIRLIGFFLEENPKYTPKSQDVKVSKGHNRGTVVKKYAVSDDDGNRPWLLKGVSRSSQGIALTYDGKELKLRGNHNTRSVCSRKEKVFGIADRGIIDGIQVYDINDFGL